jgi:type IV pilus assembly protein PilY1
MSRIIQSLRNVSAHAITRWIVLPVLCAAGLAAVVAQTATVLPPTISLSPEPLYARGARAKPTLTLALSVEFPTVGAQYVNTPGATDDPSYSSTATYVGYFDPESCYLYNRSDTDATLRYFYRTGAATGSKTTGRSCGGTGFSGNFMNWATSSAIDVLRLGLTGGDRVVDTASLTVLQRAVLPNTSYTNNFWNGSNFPSKQLTAAQAADAVPSSLLPSNFTGTLYVANCLNRMHFGTAKTGSCTTPGNNSNLGTPVASQAVGTPSAVTTTLPGTGWTNCASEGGTCSFTGVMEVAYGTNSGSGGWFTVPASNGIGCNNNMTGSLLDPKSGIAKECRMRAYTGTWTPPTGTTVLSSDQFFYTRVRVCESDTAGVLTDPRTSLCLRYPNGNYKPVGNLQKYSDRVRVAAFGYLNDNSADPQRSGGVLRAPMKYVGGRSFDANFQLISGTNPVQEWNESTGVFATNPDCPSSSTDPGCTSAPISGTFSNSPGQKISGVINYLNQFGRTGVLGQYKTYDPVGELYYESLRYLQGLQPSAAKAPTVATIATNPTLNIDDAMRDGFPVYTSYTDPHPAVSGMTDYSCVKNSIVGIGDVNTWNDKNFPGNKGTGKGDVTLTADDTTNEPDFVFWTQIVGDFEAKRATTYVDGKGVSRTTSNPNTALSTRNLQTTLTGAEGATFYMAGAAYWANTHDIRGTQWTSGTDAVAKQRPGMRVTTYWLDVNEYGQQTAAATHRNNQFYLTAKYGGFKDVTTSGNPYLKLQANKVPADNLFENDPDNLNWQRQTTDTNLREAKNYFLASSAQTALDALDEIFATVASEANSIAGGAISTTRISTSGGLVYQAQFDPADWSGDVTAYPVALNASGNALSIAGAASSPWRDSSNQPVGASGKLDDKAAADRNIYVGFNSGTPQVFGSSVFTWAAVDTSIKTALYNSATEAASLGEDRLNYLRGDRTKEAGTAGGTFRKRTSKLGDIINSGIAYVAAPTQRISDDSYATFYTTNLNRIKTLYVGANDGMLHAFNSETGAELFAYIPSFVVPNLKALTSTTYTHQSYVDGTPVAAEANLGTTSSADWRTVLVSGAGGGGQGVFALDVTDPTAFNAGNGDSKILWEFTDKHDVDMGNVIGRPQIVKINVDAGSATPNYQYFAVVASGVNNQAVTAADSNSSTTGEPTLFFLKLNKAKTAVWALGTNYFKVKFPVSETSIATGMANFATRTGFANELSFIYAGDLQGNLWKLDFRNTSASSWSLNSLSFYKDGSTAIPMFVAKDGSLAQNRQPITMEPTLTFGPNRSIIVSIGTGQYLSVADNSGPFKAQSVYTLFDNNSNVNDTSTSPAAAIAGRGRLQAGTVTASAITVPSFAWGRPTSDTATTSRSGWYFDFYNSANTSTTAGTGERQISGTEVLAGRMVFGTVIPALNSCDNGTGNLYIVDLQSGNGTASVSTVGILGEPFVATLATSSLTVSNSTGTRKETSRNQIITQGSSGLGTQPSVLTSQTVGRISWREISNYQDVRNAP